MLYYTTSLTVPTTRFRLLLQEPNYKVCCFLLYITFMLHEIVFYIIFLSVCEDGPYQISMIEVLMCHFGSVVARGPLLNVN